MATDDGVRDAVRWFGSMKVGIFGIRFSWILPGVCLPSVCLFVMAGVLSGQSFPTKFHPSIAADARVTSALRSIEQRECGDRHGNSWHRYRRTILRASTHAG
jgi:hypothetical protein